MRNRRLYALGLLLLVSACSAPSTKKQVQTDKTLVCDIDAADKCSKADMSLYETLPDEGHVFLEMNFAKANEVLKDKSFTGILYFGFANCPWCLDAIPIMNEAAKENEQSIYYIDTKAQSAIDNPKWREETTKLLNASFPLKKNDEGKPHLFVPLVVVIKNGDVTSYHLGTLDDHDANKREMSDDEENELKRIYKDMFDDIK
ncbi:MAG: transporter accessory protein [Breznakia sp.]